MSFPTGNNDRDAAICWAFEKAVNENAVSFANVALGCSEFAAQYEAEFEPLTEDEFKDAEAYLFAPSADTLPAGEQEAAEEGSSLEPCPPSPPPTSRKPTQAEAMAAIHNAQNDLQRARMRVTELGAVQRNARAALAESVTAWQTGQPKVTTEQLKRQWADDNQRYRRAVADGTIAPPQRPQPPSSAVDRAAYYSRDPSAAGFARSNNFAVPVYEGGKIVGYQTPTKGYKRGAMQLEHLQALQARTLGRVLPTQGANGKIINAPSVKDAITRGPSQPEAWPRGAKLPSER